MVNSWMQKFRPGSAAAVLGVALLVAGCGSSSSNSSAAPAAASSSSTSSNAASGALAIRTAKGKGGTYLTGASGRALYLWVADSNGKSSCSGGCAQAWPPVTTTGMPAASEGAMTADLGTITRSDGTKQVTYKGHPLYYFAGDPEAGTTNGQGSPQFGAKWWLVTPSGSAIKASGSAGGSTTSSSGGGWG